MTSDGHFRNIKGYYHCETCDMDIKCWRTHKKSKRHQNNGIEQRGGWHMNTEKPVRYYNKTKLVCLSNKVVIVNNDNLQTFKGFMTAEWDKGETILLSTGNKAVMMYLNEERTIKKHDAMGLVDTLLLYRNRKTLYNS